MNSEWAWEPTEYHTEESNIAEFMNQYGYDGYDELIPTEVPHLRRIWEDFVEDTGIVWQDQYDEVVDLSDGTPLAKWFTGGQLNAVETILDQWVSRTPDAPMYIWENEQGDRSIVSYTQMHRQSSKLANALLDRGIKKGDVVGITFPMHPNGFATALACLRIGAVFTMIFPGYGAEAIGHRLNDSGADILVTADGYQRSGIVTDLLAKVDSAVQHAPDLDDVIVHRQFDLETEVADATQTDWKTFIEDHEETVETATMESDETAFIAYSSGTTGTPKGTVHTHASLLVMGNKEAKYHFDLGQGDTLMWITDFGWIIVPIWMLAGGPALGATTILLEGGPTSPDENRVWRAIKEYDVTTFGISPTGARNLRQHNPTPREEYDLSTLCILGSTGEPWDEDGWNWYLNAVGEGDLPIINACGGTELAGAILSPTPKTPVKPGTLYGPAPGVAANIYDEQGTPTDEGYLVIEHPIPGMTHGLTSGRERYLEEYWNKFEGVWNHNDWAKRDEDDFWYITGRADDTMNIAGRRVTAPAIEETISSHEAVSEVAVVPVADKTTGQTPVAFVVLVNETADRAVLEDEIRSLVAEKLGAPFRPSSVHVVPEIPRTQTGKIPRGVLEAAYLGDSLGNVSTLDHADVLDVFPQRTN